MDLTCATEIIEICEWETVNYYVSAGWKLIDQYKTIGGMDHPDCDHQTMHYCLAWVGESPVHPEIPRKNLYAGEEYRG